MSKRLTLRVGALVCISGLFLIGPECEPPGPGEPPDALLVIRAVHDLESPDYRVVRAAIHALNDLADAPNIKIAVQPLADLLSNDPPRYDASTRSLASGALVRIGVSLGGKKGTKAITAVIEELESGNTDTVRAACAYALGRSGWETAFEPLINANEADPSPLVRAVACEALMMHTNGTYASDTCSYESEDETLAMTSGPVRAEALMLGADGSVSEEDARWLETHIITPFGAFPPIFGPNSNWYNIPPEN